MDDVRFDALARSLGRLGPRRSALKAIAGLAAGGLATRFSARSARAAISCKDVGDCPERPCQFVTCKDGICVFKGIPECCIDDADCDDGDPCTRDTCNQELSRCQHTPRPEGVACGSGKSCRSGRCRCARVQDPCRGSPLSNDCCSGPPDGVICAPSPLGDTRCCSVHLQACDHNSECCSGACRNGHCCDPAAGPCNRDEQCCGSGVCRNGQCCVPEPKSTTCQGRCGQVRNTCGRNVDCGCCGLGEVCGGNEQCCQQEPTECIFNNHAPQATCCRRSGYGCRQSGDCCGAGVCRGGSRKTCCQPPQEHCRQSGDCCGAAICRSGQCCEDRAGAICLADADCCGARLCFRPDPNSAGACT